MRGRRCGNAEDIKQTQKDRKANAPPLLPRTRPRALTFPEPSKPTQSWIPLRKHVPQRTLDQLQSPLLTLPAEVRQAIWIEVLGGHLLHIVRARQRLLAISCAVDISPDLETSQHGCWGLTTGRLGLGSKTPGYWYASRSKHPAKPVNLLPLLQTCRHTYQETISMIYADNIFDINHLDTLAYLRRSVLPQRLDQICMMNLTWHFKYSTATSLAPYDLSTWLETCESLASLAGLQELTVHLSGHDVVPHWRKKEGSLLEPLTRIKAVKRFEVFVPWSGNECAGIAKESGYTFNLLPKIEVPIELNDDDTIEL